MNINNSTVSILGWDLFSLYGIGKNDFIDAIKNNAQSESEDILPSVEKTELLGSIRVPEFDTRNFLGKKGTRTFDRHTGLTVSAVGSALKDSQILKDVSVDKNIEMFGVINCTSTGSVSSIMEFTKDTFVEERPYLVNPAHFPNTVLNCGASQSAIWYKLKGPNATISGGHASFYSGLNTAFRWLRNEYAKRILVGAVEEVSEHIANMHTHLRNASKYDRPLLAEACAMFVLQGTDGSEEEKGKHKILASEVEFYFDPQNKSEEAKEEPENSVQAKGLSGCIERCLEKARIKPKDINYVCRRLGGSHRLAQVELAGISKVINTDALGSMISIENITGDTYSATGAMQLGALITELEGFAKYALAVCIGSNGAVASMVVERGNEK